MKIKRYKELNEGTWAIPKNTEERRTQGSIFIQKIEDLKDEIYPIFGDDILFDGLDSAIKRIEELVEIPEEEIEESVNEDKYEERFGKKQTYEELKDKFKKGDKVIVH